MSKSQSDVDKLVEEISCIKTSYALCCNELVLKQSELDQLSTAYREHCRICSEELKIANEKIEKTACLVKATEEKFQVQMDVYDKNVKNWEEELHVKHLEVNVWSCIYLSYIYPIYKERALIKLYFHVTTQVQLINHLIGRRQSYD